MGFFDTFLGVPSPPKKKKHSDDSHRPRRRKIPADDHSEDASQPSGRIKDPENEEELRAARLQYLSKTPEQRSRDATRAQRREADLRATPAFPDAAQPREKRERTKTKATGGHAPRSKEKRSKTDGERRRQQVTDEEGYQYVYGPPPTAASSATAPPDAPRRSSTVRQKPAPRGELGSVRRRSSFLDDESHHHRTRDPLPETKHGGYTRHHEWHASSIHSRPAGAGLEARGHVRSVTGSQVKNSGKVLVKDDDTISVASRPTLRRSQTTSHAQAHVRPTARRRSTRPIFEDDEEPSESQPAPASEAMGASNSSTMPIREPATPASPTIDRPPALNRRKTEPAPATTDCSICLDTIPLTQKFDLTCNHTWCHSCLKRTFFISPTDGIITKPPQCCNAPVPLALAPAVLTPTELKTWNRKMREIAEKRPIYCLNKTCNGRWISPRCFFEDGRGRRFAQCSKCEGRVCLRCKAKLHEGRCKVDTGEKELLKVAEEQEWKQCPRCQILVERSEGCTHMTCRCGAEFCYKCGISYDPQRGAKACSCPIIDRMPRRPGHRGRMLDEDEAFARRLQLEMLMGLQHAAAAAPWPFFGHVSPPGQFGGQRHGHGYAGAHGGAQEPVFQHFQQPMDQHGFQQWGDGGANGGERGGWHGHGVRQDDGGFAAAFIGGFVREMRGWND